MFSIFPSVINTTYSSISCVYEFIPYRFPKKFICFFVLQFPSIKFMCPCHLFCCLKLKTTFYNNWVVVTVYICAWIALTVFDLVPKSLLSWNLVYLISPYIASHFPRISSSFVIFEECLLWPAYVSCRILLTCLRVHIVYLDHNFLQYFPLFLLLLPRSSVLDESDCPCS